MMMMMIGDLPNCWLFATQLDHCAARNLPEGRFFATQLDYCAAYSWPMSEHRYQANIFPVQVNRITKFELGRGSNTQRLNASDNRPATLQTELHGTPCISHLYTTLYSEH